MIGIQEFIEAAKKQELLKRFERRHLEKLAGLAREVRFTRDQIVFREGAHSPFFYLIVEGSVVLEIVATGRSVQFQTLHAGDAMGWSSLVDAEEGAHFEARALGPTRALAFDGAQLRAACESDPEFGYRMMKALLNLVTDRLDASRIQLVDMYGTAGAVRA